MADILVNNNFYISTSAACIVDLTPPTFAGINFADVESRGQIRVAWAAGTDVSNPIRYEVYIQASTATGLFNVTNITASTPNLQYDIFTLPNGGFLQNGVTYHVGVRAVDSVGNRDANTVSIPKISTAILTSIDIYETKAAWSTDSSNNFRVTGWANKNSEMANAPGAILGTASYQVYDKNGNIIAGMSNSSGSPTPEGVYIFPSIPSLLVLEQNHNVIKLTISVDGENRVSRIYLGTEPDSYTMDGVSDTNISNQLVGSFWVSNNEKILTSGLGSGSYQAYTASGTLIPGLSETGIVADASGFYSITPFSLPPTIDATSAYIVKVSALVNGLVRSKNLILGNEPLIFSTKGIFSINALNQLEVTMWAVKSSERANPAILGTASYTVYDKNGAAVAGLTQSGLTADVNGLFHSTPVSAALLSDLTHYTVKIEISVAGSVRTSFKGFTLLGT